MHVFVFHLLLLCSLSTTSSSESNKRPIMGFSIDLIHRDSPLSPFYNPSLTPSQLMKNAALRSISQSNRFGLSQNDNKVPKTITIPDLGIGEYLMRIYIGTPAVERFAIADTGSDLIWVQCSPCKKCVPQNSPLFNPKKSSTFKGVSCDSQPCTLLPQNWHFCEKAGKCKYLYMYGDNSYTIGNLGVDSISFGSKGGGKGIKFPKFTFGCGYYNEDTVDMDMPKNTGLVGLGAGPLSLISQLGDQIGHKFSYCLLPFGSNSTSKLKFGHEAMIKGKRTVSTPLIIKSSSRSFYYLNLEGIRVGKKMVKPIKSQIDGNIVIDSGTTFTILQQSFYNKFVTLVKEVLGGEVEQNPPEPYEFCLRYKNNQDNDDNFPNIVFHFTRAKVHLKSTNLFSLVEDNLLCVMVQPTSEDGVSIFGNQAQVGFQVEYDLERGMVSFAAADCAKH